MARVASPSIAGAALEQARGFDVSFLFDGIVYTEPEFPASLFGSRQRPDSEGPALNEADPCLDLKVEEEVQQSASAKAGGDVKSEPMTEAAR
eukprot:11164727-Lingulodinium_polyedra.AAC.1